MDSENGEIVWLQEWGVIVLVATGKGLSCNVGWRDISRHRRRTDVVSGFIRSAPRIGTNTRVLLSLRHDISLPNRWMYSFWSLRGKAYRASFADVMYHVTTGDGIFHRILRRLAGAMAVT